ncbi:MAG: (deoxy)nucleoside triphosphate pyrophosphohydrolase [Candidatus Omnitrophica bacterium]|nr:(deoxy)nucleoside triphosphate pyrophosphohydrolase [Candidatus Omnitrophota bacterium]
MRRRRHLRAAVAVIERRGRLLICRRRTGDSFGGCWEFPGGKCESGESWEVCLRRELREELGIAVRILTVCGSMRHEFADGVVSFRVFRCVIARGRPRPLAARALRWVKPDQLSRYRFPPANRLLVARLSGSASSVCR